MEFKIILHVKLISSRTRSVSLPMRQASDDTVCEPSKAAPPFKTEFLKKIAGKLKDSEYGFIIKFRIWTMCLPFCPGPHITV